MSKLRLQFATYDRPLPRPIVTAHGTYARRQGIICKLSDSTGLAGFGDAAPLPGFSHESTDDTLRAIRQLTADLSGSHALRIPPSVHELTEATALFGDAISKFSSLRFALESALADLSSRRAGVPLARWLSPTAAKSIAVNAMIDGSGSSDDLIAKAQEQFAAGFHTFKIKVGSGTVDADIKRVRVLREAVPEANIRIDANEGWSEPDAREVFAALRNCNLEFIEQPLPVGNISASRQIASDTGIPLALDEEIETAADAIALIEEQCCDVLVLKPMILGSLVDCLMITQTAKQQNMKVVFTSAWESDIGLAATMHLIAACGAESAAGLSTAGMISDQLVDQPLCIVDGELEINDAPGIGMSVVDSVSWEPS